jgi:DNA-binding response OmpR family regulator
MKVLLLEDYPDGAVILKKLLEHEGYQVECVSTLKAALECLHSNTYDIGLLDLMLPDSYGLNTLEAIRAAAPFLPVVILSALDDPALAVEALKQGARFYLRKPIEADKLLERMEIAMARP